MTNDDMTLFSSLKCNKFKAYYNGIYVGEWDGKIEEASNIFLEEEKEMKEYDVTIETTIEYKTKVKAENEKQACVLATDKLDEEYFKPCGAHDTIHLKNSEYQRRDNVTKCEEIKKQKPLILLCGKSGSGKSTVADILEKEYGLKQLRSYTTRPKRSKDEDGHIFINNTALLEKYGLEYYMRDGLNFIKVPIVKKICDHTYWCTQEQLDKADVYVIDPETAVELAKEICDKRTVHIVYLDVCETRRVYRMANRGDSYTNICKRLDEEALWTDHFLHEMAIFVLPKYWLKVIPHHLYGLGDSTPDSVANQVAYVCDIQTPTDNEDEDEG